MTRINYEVEFTHTDIDNVIEWKDRNSVKLFDKIITNNEIHKIETSDDISYESFNRCIKSVLHNGNQFNLTFSESMILKIMEVSNKLYREGFHNLYYYPPEVTILNVDCVKIRFNLYQFINMEVEKDYDGGGWGKWIVSKGKYAGTLPKRLSSMMYKTYGIKLDSQLLSILGGELGKLNSDTQVKYIQLLDGIDWESGQFGDYGSCFWGSNSGAKDMLGEVGSLSLKVYSTNEPKNNHSQDYHCDYRCIDSDSVDNDTIYSNSRCWIIPHKRGLILFNGYGYELITQVRLLSTLLGVSYKKIQLSNNGSGTDTLYINSDMGYLLGNQCDICNTDSINLSIDDKDSQDCEECGCSYRQDDLTYMDDRNLCNDCLSDNYTYCECCSEYKCNDDIYYIQDDNQNYCRYHYNRHDGFQCESCDEFKLGDNTRHYIIFDNDGESNYLEDVCEECCESNYYHCDICGKHYESECERCNEEERVAALNEESQLSLTEGSI